MIRDAPDVDRILREKNIDALIATLYETTYPDELRVAALDALGHSSDRRARVPLNDAMDDASEVIRNAAAKALVQLDLDISQKPKKKKQQIVFTADQFVALGIGAVIITMLALIFAVMLLADNGWQWDTE